MKRSVFILYIIMTPCFLIRSNAQTGSPALVRAGKYIVYRDRVMQQDKFTSRAVSDSEMLSDYRSPANAFKSAAISFKFSINGKDNEMPSGTDHHFTCHAKNGICETPVIKFGTQLRDPGPEEGSSYLAPDTKIRIRVDLGDVFDAFAKQGYYVSFRGDKIYKEDFKGVYIAGSTDPLIWDFDNLVNHPQLKLQDSDGDHVYETTLVLNRQEDEKKTSAHWKLTKDISAFPQYKSDAPISDAIYNMSLEEMIRAVEPDSTFRTGKEWAGVWTRDISYSIILSMAWLQPRVAMKSLLRKVNGKGRIIQDTGTGGAYPCSTDRMIWAVAAWEVYKATGDKNWLEKVYPVIKNSIDDDLQVIYDKETGLVKGESSFLDWREQTYPAWMQPADIFESECLGTNAVHYKGNEVLADMADILNYKTVAEKHRAIAIRIKSGINKYLWMPDKGYYAQYLYGREYKIISPRAEALGEALCVIWDIAGKERAKQIVAHTPVTDFGIPCIYPEIPDIPPYHNNAVWPFVQTFWLIASAKAGNETSVVKSIGDIYRPAAMFLTNKENLVAENGDFNGTQINSGNMLWSLSGNIGIVQKVLFGISLDRNNLSFQPFIPETWAGTRTLTNFKYRNAVLDITMEGWGNKIISLSMDGRPFTGTTIPDSLSGAHNVYIKLANDPFEKNTINNQQVRFSPPAPDVKILNNHLSWRPVKGAIAYRILKNGRPLITISQNTFPAKTGMAAEYQVVAVDKKNISSFASEPLPIRAGQDVAIYEAERFSKKTGYSYKGFSGDGFVEISKTVNRVLKIPVQIENAGWYALDFRYANGNGPTNTENKCAMRTLKIDDQQKGSFVFPQRGSGEWSNWGYSNSVRVFLRRGRHVVTLSFEDFNDNMNGEVNQAMIDYLRIVKLIFPRNRKLK